MPPRKIILGDRVLGGLPKEEPEPEPTTVQQHFPPGPNMTSTVRVGGLPAEEMQDTFNDQGELIRRRTISRVLNWDNQTITEHVFTFDVTITGGMQLTQTETREIAQSEQSFGDALAKAIVQNTSQQSQQSPEEASTPNTGWLWQSMRRLFSGDSDQVKQYGFCECGHSSDRHSMNSRIRWSEDWVEEPCVLCSCSQFRRVS